MLSILQNATVYGYLILVFVNDLTVAKILYDNRDQLQPRESLCITFTVIGGGVLRTLSPVFFRPEHMLIEWSNLELLI